MDIKILLPLLFLRCLVFGQEQSFDTTLINNKMTFQIKTKALDNDKLLLTSTSSSTTNIIDTIESIGLAYIKYPDFNNDGNADILIDYFGNNSTYFLYIFDAKTNNFIEIENYSDFPDAIQLKSKSTFYYSYHRAGCADMNWVSDLFIIENFKITHIGHILGKGCDFEINENPQKIYIYKVLNNDEENKELIENLPYLKFIPDFGDKWDFIDKYWNMNFTKFE